MKLTRQEIIAGILALLPFVAHIGYTESTTVNGVVTNYTSINFLGILFALIALKMVGSEWADIPRYHAEHKHFHWAVLVGIGLLATVQLVYSIDI